jgi:BirA family transcriptional regulator, biotin operon repressor / biotin---[acetyl-CoA-carboxylase] ligase
VRGIFTPRFFFALWKWSDRLMVRIHYLQETSSTNKVAYDLALNGEPSGTAVIAVSQGEGRGRLGKVWQSPPGKGLYCSIIVRPHLALEDYPKITLTAGLAVAIALEEITGLEMRLKWPNDVYADGKKCCGILTESSSLTEEREKRFAIVGIGINVNTENRDFPLDLQSKATSLRLLTGTEYDIQEIFHRVRMHLLEKLRLFESFGFGAILKDWRKRDMLSGKWLQWVSTSGEIIYGQSEGPDDAGRLMAKDQEGNMHQILSGDISLAEKFGSKGCSCS